MLFESWWLLAIPVLFGLGWMAARIDLTELLHESKQLPRSYFNGLNFLLNDQADRAIEAFIEVVKLNPETVELHFALGSLFRRRGETERAIRIHRNLLERPDLPLAFRDQAMFCLAQDYQKAGLLDRAESAFKQLEKTPYSVRAQQALSEIYQIESDWPRAIAAAQTSLASPAESASAAQQLRRNMAHYWCEIARNGIDQADWTGASAALAQARLADPDLLRIAQLEIALAIGCQEIANALALITQIQRSAPSFAPLLAPLLLKAQPDHAERNASTLAAWFDQAPAESLAIKALAQWQLAGQPNTQLAFAQTALSRHPSLALSAALLDQKIALNPSDTSLDTLSKPIKAIVARERRYECSHCGFRTTQFYWQCPGCKKWETLPYAGL